MKNCTGYIVDGFSGGEGNKGKVYVGSLMPSVSRSNSSKTVNKSANSANQIYINADQATRPKPQSKLNTVNYITIPIKHETVWRKVNQDKHEMFLKLETVIDKHLDSITWFKKCTPSGCGHKRPPSIPVKFFDTPIEANIPAGTKVTVESKNNDISSMTFTT